MSMLFGAGMCVIELVRSSYDEDLSMRRLRRFRAGPLSNVQSKEKDRTSPQPSAKESTLTLRTDLTSPIRMQPKSGRYNPCMGKTVALKLSLPRLALILLIGIGSWSSLGFLPYPGDDDGTRPPKWESIQLQVKPLQQKKITSCGEAAITMAYNHAYPDTPLAELDVIDFAMEYGYYVDDRRPYTSPDGMIAIANHYASTVSSGTVSTPEQGLALLFDKLHNNQPVIIDIWTYLNIPYSDAHFVLVTGISKHPEIQGAYIIHYNNPLTARNESARWEGREGIWNAWQNNGDPGGSGWWMTISAEE